MSGEDSYAGISGKLDGNKKISSSYENKIRLESFPVSGSNSSRCTPRKPSQPAIYNNEFTDVDEPRTLAA
jgi:hypothetical protein